MDSLNGFGGLACKALEYLKDEYSNKNIIAMPVLSDNYILQDETSELQAVNTSLLFSSLFEHSNMFVPLTTSSGGWIKNQSHLILDYLSYKVKCNKYFITRLIDLSYNSFIYLQFTF